MSDYVIMCEKHSVVFMCWEGTKVDEKKIKTIVVAILDFLSVILLGLAFRAHKDDLTEWSEQIGVMVNIYSILFPVGIVHAFNYFLLAPLFYRIYQKIKKYFLYDSYISSEYKSIIGDLINWLVSCRTHWGLESNANVAQNANTCEGLLALRSANQHKKRSEIYVNAFKMVDSNASVDGLPSKSLQRPTVVCTSMLLYLVARELEDPVDGISVDYDKYNKMIERLWEARSEQSGWGVYVDKVAEDYECSLANTYWALRALSQFEIGKSAEFCRYVRLIYQRGNNSRFGFKAGDSPRLTTTAMYLCLYNELDVNVQMALSSVYNPAKALSYIYTNFTPGYVQIEHETLLGLKSGNNPGPVKAPWKHIAVGYVLDAMLVAVHNKELNTVKANRLFDEISKLIRDYVMVRGDGQRCYVPKDMEYCSNGDFTFPTAYLVQGLSKGLKLDDN